MSDENSIKSKHPQGVRTRSAVAKNLHVDCDSQPTTMLPPPPLSAGAESSTDNASPTNSTPTPPSGIAATLPSDKESANATGSNNGNNPNQPREKRKRSRVTPEQLVQLERIFMMDKSPTAQRRKEISEALGMQERQTQIWFQNRRAKAKLQEVKRSSMGLFPGAGDSSPANMANPGYEDILALLHEDEPVTIIPCSELSVGSWRRIATPPSYPLMGSLPPPKSSHDLIAYMSGYRRTLNWYIHSHGYGFKMEIPFDIIAHTEYSEMPPNGPNLHQLLGTFHLSRPPNFYLETSVPVPPGRMGMGGYPPVSGYGSSPSGMTTIWKRCADWTEGMQASSVLRHDLIATSPPVLYHVLRVIRGELASPHSAGPFSSMSSSASSPHSQGPPGGPIGPNTPLQLLTPPYSSNSAPPSADPSSVGRLPPPLPLSLPHVQPPPMASLGTPPGTPSLSGGYGGYDSSGGATLPPPSHHEPNRPRSYTAPGGTTAPSLHDATFSSHHSSPYSAHPSYGSHQPPAPEPPLHHPSHLGQYSSNRTSYGSSSSHPGDYNGGYPASSNGLDYVGSGLQPPQRSSSASLAHTPTPTPPNHNFDEGASPPLLTTPFSPTDSLLTNNQPNSATDMYPPPHPSSSSDGSPNSNNPYGLAR